MPLQQEDEVTFNGLSHREALTLIDIQMWTTVLGGDAPQRKILRNTYFNQSATRSLIAKGVLTETKGECLSITEYGRDVLAGVHEVMRQMV